MRVKPLVLVALLALLAAVPDARAQDPPRMGGGLEVATIGEPPTHFWSSWLAR